VRRLYCPSERAAGAFLPDSDLCGSQRRLQPLQKAWEELDVPQCGYCQAGQIMSAAALLVKTPKPTDSDIDSAMNGNLCRCGTYVRIRQAIHRAAGEVAL
jgi:isoquinoline 1-oxidoreductase alpha subunit